MRRFATRAGLLLAAVFLFPPSSSAASPERPVLRLIEGGRASLGSKDTVPSELVTRLEADFRPGEDSRWRFVPFAEFRKNLDNSGWSRMEFGAEAGVTPFMHWKESDVIWQRPLSWIYLGQGIQRAWLSPGGDTMESETRFLLEIPLLKLTAGSLLLYGADEYTYDLERGEGVRNEFIAGFKVPLPVSSSLRLTALLGFRHVDQVHLDDDDQFEGSLQLEF